MRVFALERNFRIHTIITLIILILGVYFNLNALEWGVLLGFVGLVVITEIINSCLERFLDATLAFRNNRTRDIKDMAAGAVLAASVLAVIVGLLIFLPKF